MKRSMILAACLCLCLSHLSGCAQQEEAPDALQQSAPSQNQPVEPISEQPEQPAPVEEVPAEPEEPAEPPYEFPGGVWLAKNDVGYTNYYTFDSATCSGRYVSLDYGLGASFTYGGSGDELVFQMDDGRADCAATVEHTDEESFALLWEDSLPEVLTHVSEKALDEFHFFSNDELAQMATDHYAMTNEDVPTLSGTLTNEDNTVTVQLYENLGDHNSTAAWYIVDRFTATGTDLLSGEEIDLLEHTQEEPAEDQPAGDTETPTGEEILPGTEEPSTEDEDVIFAVPET